MHSLAEVYFALTRMPGDTRAHPRQAMEYVTSMAHHSTLIALEADDYVKAIELVSGRGMSGGMIYDALLLTCARKAKADRIYTWNLRHFRMIAPDLAERIVAPGE
jgi:predicted nucleic acid-binding protein